MWRMGATGHMQLWTCGTSAQWTPGLPASSSPPPQGRLSSKGAGKMRHWLGRGCGRGLLPDPQSCLPLSGKSSEFILPGKKKQNKIKESDSLLGFTGDFTAAGIPPLILTARCCRLRRVGRQGAQAAQELKRRRCSKGVGEKGASLYRPDVYLRNFPK